MKIYFDALIRDFDETPIKWPQGHSLVGKEMTLGAVAVDALSAIFQDEQGIDGNAKQRRFNLAIKAYSAQVEEMTAEEIGELKKVIGKMYGPLIVGRAYQIIEQAADDQKKPKLKTVQKDE